MHWVNSKYAIERPLGSGGMAEVFVARALGAAGFTRRVAIKRVLGGFMTPPHLADMFIAEAQLTARLQHPNIVSVLDFDRDAGGEFFLVMELIEGVRLADLIGAGPLSVPLIIYLAIEILTGLRYAHDLPPPREDGIRGIIHRDISPHNVLLSWEGAVKISDFGIAKVRATSVATASQIVKGKPAYMSPEQALARPLDGRSDLFAVGVMLWQMLCGRHPFQGANLQEMLAQLVATPIPSPRAVRPDLPEDVSRVVAKLLARDVAQRTPHAGAALDELVACVDHPRNGREVLIDALEERFPGRAPPSKPGPPKPPVHGVETLTQLPGAIVDPVAPAIPSRRRGRARRAWIAAGSCVAAAGLLGAAFLVFAGTSRPATPTSGTGAPDTQAISPASSEIFGNLPHATMHPPIPALRAAVSAVSVDPSVATAAPRAASKAAVRSDRPSGHAAPTRPGPGHTSGPLSASGPQSASGHHRLAPEHMSGEGHRMREVRLGQ